MSCVGHQFSSVVSIGRFEINTFTFHGKSVTQTRKKVYILVIWQICVKKNKTKKGKMSGLFTRHFAVLNIDGEHLVYRRDREIGENNDDIIFQNGIPVQQDNQNEQHESNANIGKFFI